MIKNYMVFMLIGISMLFFSCSREAMQQIKIHNGTLDLSAYDFNKNQPLYLLGKWKFKWLSENPDYILPDYDDTDWETIDVPGLWNRSKGTGLGYGYLRARIKVMQAGKLGILLDSALTAYDLYVNGKKLFSSGVTGQSRAKTIPQQLLQLEKLPDTGEWLQLTWKISNFHFVNGGPAISPVLGEIGQLLRYKIFSQLSETAIIGGLLIIAVIFFSFWINRREEKAFLYFALACFFVALRSFFHNSFFEILLPEVSSVLFEVRYKVVYITSAISAGFISLFIRELFREVFPLFAKRIVLGFAVPLGVFMLFAPTWFFTRFILFYHFVLLVNSLILIVIVLRALHRGMESALTILVGYLLFILTLLNDALYTLRILITTNTNAVGFLLLFLSHAIALSRRLSGALNTAQYLSRNLREEVAKQTDTLMNQNREIDKKNKELGNAKDKVEQLIQQKTRFFINLAHETKTPLTVIKNYLGKYMNAHPPDNDLEIIRRNIDKLLRDMVNFLDLEKLEHGQIFYNHETVLDFSALLKEKILLFKEVARKKQISFYDCGVDDCICIKADSFALDRIINNLLDNAIKYNKQHGEIHIRLTQNSRGICFTIRDTGRGIEKEKQQKIFTPYEQLSEEKRNIQGIGMGLSIVKQIVDSLEGEIRVASAPGTGTEFALVFPALPAACMPAGNVCREELSAPLDLIPAASPAPVHVYDAARKTILIVEDNIELLDIISGCLEDKYNLLTAFNGVQALEIIGTHAVIDLVISDVMMDEMDGYTLFHKTMQELGKPDIPFIFMTARNSNVEKQEMLQAGAIDYLFKPFPVEELAAKADALLKLDAIKKKLQEKEKYAAIGRLVSGISHEIFNPLSGIKGPLHVIKQQLKNQAPQIYNQLEEGIAYIDENIIRIEDLIKSLKLLSYNSIEKEEPVKIKPLVESIIRLIHKDVRTRITVSVEMEDELEVLGNYSALNHILINLVMNAAESIAGPGTIRIRASYVQYDFILKVLDTGCGISEYSRERIFDLFYTTKEKGESIGYGLYLVKDLVQKLDWEIYVESQVKCGTTFTLIKRGNP